MTIEIYQSTAVLNKKSALSLPGSPTNLVDEYLNDLRHCESLAHRLPGQTEVLDSQTLPNGVRLCSARLNDAHRLVYATYTTSFGLGIFVALEVISHHQHQKARLLNSNEARRDTAAALTDFIQGLENQAMSLPLRSPTLRREKVMARSQGQYCLLSEAQYAMTQHDHRGVIFLGTGGTGKTLTALEWMLRKLHQSMPVVYISTETTLCDKVRETLKEHALPFDHRRPLPVRSWKQIAALITECFPNSALTPFVDLIPANFTDFERWVTLQKSTNTPPKSSAKKDVSSPSKKIDMTLFDVHELYAEFTQTIIQAGDDLQQAHLTLEQYRALGVDQAYIAGDLRRDAYQLFQRYLNALSNDKKYEPHLHLHEIYRTLSNANPIPESLKLSAYVLDEVQQMHPWQLHCLFQLLDNPKSGDWFLCGDPHQIFNRQRRRVIEPIYHVLKTHGITEPTLVVQGINYRSAQNISHLANLLLHMQQAWWGSSEREAVFSVTADTTKIPGAIRAHNAGSMKKTFGDERAEKSSFDQFVQARDAMVLIPDAMPLEEAKTIWGPRVLPLAKAGGLEWDYVVMYGFNEYHADEMKELHISALHNTPDLTKPMHYARKKGQIVPRLSSRNLHHAFLLAAQRARISIDLVEPDNALVSEFALLLVNAIHPVETVLVIEKEAIASPIYTQATPADLLTEVKTYISALQFQLAFDLLFSEALWGTEKAANSAKKLCINQKFQIQHVASVLGLVEKLFNSAFKNEWLLKAAEIELLTKTLSMSVPCFLHAITEQNWLTKSPNDFMAYHLNQLKESSSVNSKAQHSTSIPLLEKKTEDLLKERFFNLLDWLRIYPDCSESQEAERMISRLDPVFFNDALCLVKNINELGPNDQALKLSDLFYKVASKRQFKIELARLFDVKPWGSKENANAAMKLFLPMLETLEVIDTFNLSVLKKFEGVLAEIKKVAPQLEKSPYRAAWLKMPPSISLSKLMRTGDWINRAPAQIHQAVDHSRFFTSEAKAISDRFADLVLKLKLLEEAMQQPRVNEHSVVEFFDAIAFISNSIMNLCSKGDVGQSKNQADIDDLCDRIGAIYRAILLTPSQSLNREILADYAGAFFTWYLETFIFPDVKKRLPVAGIWVTETRLTASYLLACSAQLILWQDAFYLSISAKARDLKLNLNDSNALSELMNQLKKESRFNDLFRKYQRTVTSLLLPPFYHPALLTEVINSVDLHYLDSLHVIFSTFTFDYWNYAVNQEAPLVREILVKQLMESCQLNTAYITDQMTCIEHEMARRKINESLVKHHD